MEARNLVSFSRTPVLAAAMLVFASGQAVAVESAAVRANAAGAVPVLVRSGDEEVAPIADPNVDGERRVITGFDIRYTQPNDSLPAVEDVLAAEVELGQVTDGFVAVREGIPTVRFSLADVAQFENATFYDSALAAISPAVVAQLQRLGMIGVYVEPNRDQIRVVDSEIKDLRGGTTTLTLDVTTGIVTEIRSSGLGERLNPEDTLNHPFHARIRDKSPVQAVGNEAGKPSVLRGDLLDDYVNRLNRHPGRRVDVAVAAVGDKPGSVSLDYIVTENRPWLLFGQARTTSGDDWRYKFGFIHNQLTNRDDTLDIQYSTSFDDDNTLTASYERPVGFDDRLRARAYGSWYSYSAGDVGQPDATFEGEGYSLGGELIWNFLQNRDFFVDAVGGVRLDHQTVDNGFAFIEGSDDIVIGYAGARMERTRPTSRIWGSGMFDFTLNGLQDDQVNNFGRTNADDSWVVFHGDLGHSFYLEPFFTKGLEDAQSLAHEVAVSARGQYSFGNRLIPNYEEVLGGLYTVRGYPENIIAGDDMIVGTVEYRLHLPSALPVKEKAGTLAGKPFRWNPQYLYGPTDWDFIVRGFVDAGRITNSDRLSFEQDETLVGAGFGAELALTRRFNLRADLGWALTDINGAGGTPLVEKGNFELYFVATLVY